LGRVSCEDSILETARDCELILPDRLLLCRNSPEFDNSCSAFVLAKLLLESYAGGECEKLELLLANLVEQYKYKRKDSDCVALRRENAVLCCTTMAPVIMDFLLQLLQPYI